MRDYSELGLDPYLRATDSLSVKSPTYVTAFENDSNYELLTNLNKGTINTNSLRTDGTIIMFNSAGNRQVVLDHRNETFNAANLRLGGTEVGLTASGALTFIDSGVTFGNMTVDEFYFQNTITAGIGTTNGGQFLVRGTSSPNAPVANSCILYTDVVSGTVRLIARFPTGAVQVITQQP